jgi:hypothetical protein
MGSADGTVVPDSIAEDNELLIGDEDIVSIMLLLVLVSDGNTRMVLDTPVGGW